MKDRILLSEASLAAALQGRQEPDPRKEEPETTDFKGEYFTPLSDAEVPKRYRSTLAKYRQLAREHGFATTAVCHRVRAGYTLKRHAPKAGPCHERFQYLQGWDFPDEPTVDSYVFWIPLILAGSTYKSTHDQRALLAKLRTRLDLPVPHLRGFGKVALVAGLILTHFEATGERSALVARTDTCIVGGRRLSLSWHEGALRCVRWDVGDGPFGDVGVFALGVEVLGS